jgi:hypothetical protein
VTTGLPRPGECRDCADPIRFVHLESGRTVPVNPLPARDGAGTIAARLVRTTDGRQLRGYALSKTRGPEPHNPLRFTVHAATCKSRPANAPPGADQPDEADTPMF